MKRAKADGTAEPAARKHREVPLVRELRKYVHMCVLDAGVRACAPLCGGKVLVLDEAQDALAWQHSATREFGGDVCVSHYRVAHALRVLDMRGMCYDASDVQATFRYSDYNRKGVATRMTPVDKQAHALEGTQHWRTWRDDGCGSATHNEFYASLHTAHERVPPPSMVECVLELLQRDEECSRHARSLDALLLWLGASDYADAILTAGSGLFNTVLLVHDAQATLGAPLLYGVPFARTALKRGNTLRRCCLDVCTPVRAIFGAKLAIECVEAATCVPLVDEETCDAYEAACFNALLSLPCADSTEACEWDAIDECEWSELVEERRQRSMVAALESAKRIFASMNTIASAGGSSMWLLGNKMHAKRFGEAVARRRSRRLLAVVPAALPSQDIAAAAADKSIIGGLINAQHCCCTGKGFFYSPGHARLTRGSAAAASVAEGGSSDGIGLTVAF